MRSSTPSRWFAVATAMAGLALCAATATPFEAAAQKQRSRTEKPRAEDEAPDTREGELDSGPRYKKSDADTEVSKTARVVDQVAVVIENDIITLSDLRERAGTNGRGLFDPNADTTIETERQKALKGLLDVMIEERLLKTEVKKMGLEATPGEVDQMVSDVLRSNNLTREQLVDLLQRQGQSFEDYKRNVRAQVERAKILGAKVRSRIRVSDDDVRNFYMQNYVGGQSDRQLHIRHILAALPGLNALPAEDEAALKKIEAAQARINAGEAFETVAAEVSEDPSKRKGGDLGFLKRDDMIESFATVAFALKPGQVSKPVRTEFGWHLIKLEEIKVGEAQPFDEVKDQIRNKLTQDGMEREYATWLAELRRRAHIVVQLSLPLAGLGPDASGDPAKAKKGRGKKSKKAPTDATAE